MSTHERQQAILDLIADAGRVTVAALAARFGVSDDTVRRDLQALADDGVLQKTHGGAVALDVPAMARVPRQRVLAPVKQALGAALAATVTPGQILMLDAGDTLLAVARALPDVALTVITPSLDIAVLLGARPRIRLVLAGGEWCARQRLFHGEAAEALIASCRADVAVLGACAVDVQGGLTATDAADARLKRLMLASAGTRVLVADHSKFERRQPWAVAPLADFDHLYTDRPVALPPTGGPAPAITVVTPPQELTP